MTRIVFFPGALAELLASKDGPVAKDLERRAVKVETQAKRLCPVDTGRLRSSITHRLERDSQGLVEMIGTDVDYAAAQEFGTSTQRGTPYLRPALSAAGGVSRT